MTMKTSGTLVYLGGALAAYCPGQDDEVPPQASAGESMPPKRDPRKGRDTVLPAKLEARAREPYILGTCGQGSMRFAPKGKKDR